MRVYLVVSSFLLSGPDAALLTRGRLVFPHDSLSHLQASLMFSSRKNKILSLVYIRILSVLFGSSAVTFDIAVSYVLSWLPKFTTLFSPFFSHLS